jgi:hemerythrin-like metal-binding protein
VTLFADFESRHILGVPAMDGSHRELIDLVNRMERSGNAAFAYLFPDLVNHSSAHFAFEEVLMRDTAFPGEAAHRADHHRILGELDWLARGLAQGRVAPARAWVHDRFPAWFAGHLDSMDSALATHLRGIGVRARGSAKGAAG